MATRAEYEELNALRGVFEAAKNCREAYRKSQEVRQESVLIEAAMVAEGFAEEVEHEEAQELFFKLIDELEASGVVKPPSP